MNTKFFTITLLTVMILVGAATIFYLQNRITKLEEQIVRADTPSAQVSHEEAEGTLLTAMDRFQRFSTKLWYAGQSENWELAHFYAHEIEEVMEELKEANIQEEGYKIADLVAQMPEPALQEVEQGIEHQNIADFSSGYRQLVNACNSCHTVTKKSFIQIQVPDRPSGGNQTFSLTTYEAPIE